MVIILLKNEFPNLRSFGMAYENAAYYGYKETLILLKKEFSAIKGTFNAVSHALYSMHYDTIKLLLYEFHYIINIPESFDLIVMNGNIKIIELLKLLYPTHRGTGKVINKVLSRAFMLPDILMLIKEQFPDTKVTSEAYTNAVIYCDLEAIKLIKKEYPYIRCDANAFIRCILL